MRVATAFLALLPLLAALAEQRESADAVSASTVTIKGRFPLSEVIGKLRQSGNQIVISSGDKDEDPGKWPPGFPNPVLQLDLSKETFWLALDRVCRQAGLAHEMGTAADGGALIRLRTNGPPDGTRSVAYDGPFRLALKDVKKEQAMVEIAVEPRLRPLLLRVRPDSFQIVGDDDRPRAAGLIGAGEIRMLGEYPKTLHLRLPAAGPNKIKRLDGRAAAVVAPGFLDFRLPAAAAGQQAEQRGVKLTLTRLERAANPRLWRMSILLSYPAVRFPFDSYHTWVAEQNVIVLRHPAAAMTWKPRGQPEISVEEGGRVRVSYRFLDDSRGELRRPGDWSLEYRALAAPVEYPVQFQFPL
jgi:hypothetical protein